MAIKPVNDPETARSIAESAFGSMTAPGGGAGSTGISSGDSQIGSVAIYNVPIKEVANGGLESAVRTGWRYVQVHPNVSIGEIVEVDDALEEPVLGSFAVGRMAGLMSDAANEAERELGHSQNEYEPRILRLPEIHMEALWLHDPNPAGDDHFYGLPNSQKHLKDKDFLDTARTRASEYLERLAEVGDENALAPDLGTLQKNRIVE